MTLNRVRITLTGFSGLPGIATFYFGSSTTDMSALRTFWVAASAVFPTGMSSQIANTGDQINEDSGIIQGAWSGPAQTAIPGSGGAGGVSSAEGVMCRYTTPQVVDGRRPVGKTFLVPCVTSVFTTAGQIATTTQSSIQSALTALIAAYAGEMKIWHRPKAGHGGVGCTITAGSVLGKQVVLRSRRD